MAFKMKGSPMHRNYGHPFKDTGDHKHPHGATEDLLSTLDAHGKGGKDDPVVVKKGKQKSWENRGISIPDNYNELDEKGRNLVKNSPKAREETALNEEMAETFSSPVTGDDIKTQALATNRKNAKAAADTSKKAKQIETNRRRALGEKGRTSEDKAAKKEARKNARANS